MTEPIFIDGYIDEKYWHWKYQYYCDCFTQEAHNEVYEWLLENIHTALGWYVRDDGVIIFEEEDAMAFKLRWV